MEVETKSVNTEADVGPSEKQIESLLISFLNGLIAEQERGTSSYENKSPTQEISQ